MVNFPWKKQENTLKLKQEVCDEGDEGDFMLLPRNTKPDMGSASDVYRSEKVLGEQSEYTNPDMSSASDFDRLE